MVDKNSFFTLALSIMLLSGMRMFGEDSKKTTVEMYPINADSTLTMDLQAGGDVFITGWDNEEIRITMTKNGYNTDSIIAETSQSPSGITIRSEKVLNTVPNGSLTVEINLPKTCAHNFSLAGGDVTILGVTGEITGKTMGGNITLENATGRIQATTMGGNIKVTRAHDDLRLSTMGGKVTVKDAESSLFATTMGGTIDASFLDNEKMDGRTIDLSTQGGWIKLAVPENFSMSIDAVIEVRKSLFDFFRIKSIFPLTLLKDEETRNGVHIKLHKGSGIIGSGGVPVKLATVNGNIDIRGR